MKFKCFTLFPEMFESFMRTSIIGRAIKEEKLSIDFVNYRDHAPNKHKSVDDTPYGGGSGMLIKPDCLSIALKAEYGDKRPYTVYMSPRGELLTHSMAMKLAKVDEIAIVCGHYEGVDQRFIDAYVDAEISIGDYVLTGGELPAMVLIDAVSRLTGDVLGNDESHLDESHADGLLEYPHYTRPEVFEGVPIPDVLKSGHHENIDLWKFEQSLIVTKERRPDIFNRFVADREKTDKLSKKKKKILAKHTGK